MEGLDVEFQVAVLTVPDLVSDDEFPRWLRREVLAIQETCAVRSFAIVRLFSPRRIRQRYSHTEIDSLLQSLTDRHKNVHRIELVFVDAPLKMEELEIIRCEAEKELADVLASIALIQQQNSERKRLH